MATSLNEAQQHGNIFLHFLNFIQLHFWSSSVRRQFVGSVDAAALRLHCGSRR